MGKTPITGLECTESPPLGGNPNTAVGIFENRSDVIAGQRLQVVGIVEIVLPSIAIGGPNVEAISQRCHPEIAGAVLLYVVDHLSIVDFWDITELAAV